MSVVQDILRSWRNPRGLIRDRVATGSEPTALATLMGACFLMFVAQWPRNARMAELDPSVPLDARTGGSLMAVIFLLPLVMYLIALASHLIARLFGGKGTGLGARFALFQTLMAVSPLGLLYGLVVGVQGPGPASLIVGLVWLAGFLWMWLTMLVTVERGL